MLNNREKQREELLAVGDLDDEHPYDCGDPDCPGHYDDLPFPDATAHDPEAENDPSLRDLETICASCGLPHYKDSYQRDCPCSRHIDHSGVTACTAAVPGMEEK